ncbi:MAG: hypothetical protein K1X72_07965 [Pyrinomonadaceae bacterium]|nr:hypothetical protein [Pyrinomonadaceae bacterium]
MNWKLILPVFIFIFVVALGIFYVWYNRPNDEVVKKDFLAKNPTFEVKSLYVGEGNSDFAEYHINYKKPNDEKVYEFITTYQKCDDNEWRIDCHTK